MRIRPNERQFIIDIFSEEIDEASRRISERLTQFECPPAESNGDKFDGVRRFYEDLTGNAWDEGSEEALQGLGDVSENEVKKLMREAFLRSRMHPIPNFGYLINLMKKAEPEASQGNGSTESLNNPDAVSAADRERIANLLHNALIEASSEIASRLNLGEAKADVIREQLQVVEGRIVGEFTPLV
ncbi:MAG TPA: hypothetical protein VE262_18865 [Blastocatellia bacterium]|nr:hypothetical protein [Blastocatellia bacterium]